MTLCHWKLKHSSDTLPTTWWLWRNHRGSCFTSTRRQVCTVYRAMQQPDVFHCVTSHLNTGRRQRLHCRPVCCQHDFLPVYYHLTFLLLYLIISLGPLIILAVTGPAPSLPDPDPGILSHSRHLLSRRRGSSWGRARPPTTEKNPALCPLLRCGQAGLLIPLWVSSTG